jgi:general secretion pathway protein C
MVDLDYSDSQAMGAANDAPGAVDEGEPAATEDPMQLVESYRQRLADDAAGTLNELGLETVDASAGGGYRIGDVAQSPYLQQTGLQPGDVILSVNGRPVGDIQQDQMELANIMAQGSARIEVQRGSRRFFITASLGNMK